MQRSAKNGKFSIVCTVLYSTASAALCVNTLLGNNCFHLLHCVMQTVHHASCVDGGSLLVLIPAGYIPVSTVIESDASVDSCRQVMTVPTADPLDEKVAWRYFRDIVLGIEYCEYSPCTHCVLRVTEWCGTSFSQ